MRDADDTCIAVCSMENVDPLGVHTGDSIVVAPVQTLRTPVHQRLRSAALAIIRALGVEGGCNVQFALSPDSTEYAVIEVNPRVSRSSALASQGDRLPDRPGRRPDRRRPAAGRDPERRHRHDRRRVRAGPRLRRRQDAALPVRQVPDRRPDARQPDEGDRRGDGDRPDLRVGAEQGAPRPRAGRRRAARRGPELDADVRLPRRGLRRPTAEATTTSRSAGSTRAAPGLRIHAPRPAHRRPDRPPPLPRAVRLAAVARCSACSAAASPRRRSRRRPGSRRGSSPRWPATWPSRQTYARPASAARLATTRPARRPRCSRPRSGPGSATASWRASPAIPEPAVRARPRALGLRPGYAMVDTCAAEFAAETPYFYATYAAAGSAPEAPPVERPAALVIGSGPVRIGQGIEFDYCAVQAAETLRQPRLAGGDDQLQPGDGLDRLRRQLPPLLRAARPRERAERHRGRDRRAATCLLPAVVAFGGQTPLNLAAPLAGRRRSRCSAATSRPSTRPRTATASRPSSTAWGSRSRTAAWPTASRRRDPRRPHRLPGHRPAELRHRRPRDRVLLLARGLSRQLAAATVSTPSGPSASTGTSRASRSTSTRSATASGS